MPDGHINACRYQETGICTCRSESLRYLRLASLSLLMFVTEIIGGLLSGSLALISDAFHTLFDGTESILSAFVSHRSRFSKNEERVRKIGGFLSAILVSLVAYFIATEALERLMKPVDIHSGWGMMFAVLAVGINFWQFRIHESAPHEHHNITHAWQKLHIVTDISGSVLAFIGIALAALGFPSADVYVSFAIVLFIWMRALQYVIRMFFRKPAKSNNVHAPKKKQGRYHFHGDHRH